MNSLILLASYGFLPLNFSSHFLVKKKKVEAQRYIHEEQKNFKCFFFLRSLTFTLLVSSSSTVKGRKYFKIFLSHFFPHREVCFKGHINFHSPFQFAIYLQNGFSFSIYLYLSLSLSLLCLGLINFHWILVFYVILNHDPVILIHIFL